MSEDSAKETFNEQEEDAKSVNIADDIRQNKTLTLENIWVMGLVTLMLNNPATQSKKPKTPVTKLPHANTVPFQDGVLINS